MSLLSLNLIFALRDVCSLFVCLVLYVPGQQLWSLRDGQLPNHTFSWAGLNKRLTSNFRHILSLVTDKQPFLNESAEGRRMTVEIIS